MQDIIDIYKKTKNLHHAYFILGNPTESVSLLRDFLEEVVGIKTSGSSDFWHGKFHNLSIDEARNIIRMSENRDFAGGRKVFVIETDFITEEAQNSFLKAFEEPTPGTSFFIVSSQDTLLPTLNSRVMRVVFPVLLTVNRERTKSLLSMNIKDRVDEVKRITDSIKDEESTKQDAIRLLNQVELELYGSGLEKNSKALELCQAARSSLYDRGAPVKMILENLLINI